MKNKESEKPESAGKQSDMEQIDRVYSRLRAEWGDKYKEKLAAAARAAQRNPELIDFLEASGLGNDRQIVKVFAALGDDVTLDDDEKDEKDSSKKKSPHARAAKSIIRAVMRGGNRTAYFDDKDPGEHAEMVETMRRLYEFTA